MCGIAGLVTWSERRAPRGRFVADAMARALAHRGPDGLATACVRGPFAPGGGEALAALVHTRLAVIDRSAAAREPFVSEDGALRLVFNGEIYNHRALRAELEARGHRFVSRSDAEVVLHLYEEEGEALCRRLEGMYAFCVLDRVRGRCLLARDPVGEKPLLLASAPDGFAFASEMGALLAGEQAGGLPVRRQVDREAIGLYLHFGFIPAPRTVFEKVRRLEPGEVRVWEQGRWRHVGVERRVCGARGAGAVSLPRGGSLVVRVRRALERAVCERLEADVPLGGLLSGGIDSAVVCGIARRALGSLDAFTMGFDLPRWDERDVARRSASHIGARHHVFVADDRVLERVAPMVLRHGEPFADESALVLEALAACVQPHVTVALSGDGGDELFLGYRRRRLLAPLARLDALVPAALRRALARVFAAPGCSSARGRWDQVRRLLAALGDDASGRYARWLGILPGERARAQAVIERAGGARSFDLRVYLPEDLLRKADLASMAHGLELRAPFCDPELIALAQAIPERRHAPTPWRSKALVLAAFPDLVHPAVAAAPKRGFGVPLGAWFRRAPWPERIARLLANERFAQMGWVDAQRVRRVLEAHFERGRDCARAVYALLVLELFCRQVLDRARPGPVLW